MQEGEVSRGLRGVAWDYPVLARLELCSLPSLPPSPISPSDSLLRKVTPAWYCTPQKMNGSFSNPRSICFIYVSISLFIDGEMRCCP